jgi:hypothetical protein
MEAAERLKKKNDVIYNACLIKRGCALSEAHPRY